MRGFREIRTKEKITDNYRQIKPEKELTIKQINDMVNEEINKLRQRNEEEEVRKAMNFWDGVFETNMEATNI